MAKLSPFTYLLVLFLPCILLLTLLVDFVIKWQSLSQAKIEIERVYQKNLSKEASVKKENRLLEKLKKADHFYIDKHIETLNFLEPEIKKIEPMLVENPLNVDLQRRLQFLKSTSNRLIFIEEKRRKAKGFVEIEEKQQYPVEVNEEDLKRTLSLIEGMTIWPYGPKENPPQLLIRGLELTRKESASQEKVFLLRMHLLRRECSP